MSLSKTLTVPQQAAGFVWNQTPPDDSKSLGIVAPLVARLVGEPVAPGAFVPLAGCQVSSNRWRVRLETPLSSGAISLIVKVVPAADREPAVLSWLATHGHLAPYLYYQIRLSDQLHLLLLEDRGDTALPLRWLRQARLAEAVVGWFSRIARIKIPDPAPADWVDWSCPQTLIAAFESAWAALRALRASFPAVMTASEFDLVAEVFRRRATIAQRLRPVSRRLIHGELTPDRFRISGETTIQIHGIDWSAAGRGPLAFDLFDLLWNLPEAEFCHALENLVCLMPFDVRPELTAPVLRLTGVVKAFLHAGNAAAWQLERPRAEPVGLRTAVTRLAQWHTNLPAQMPSG